ncbi:MAG: flagellar hook-associated protein 2 [Firmicutes bacterium]|nr:flagellar hook-associated protein 2 [Bacillota bacterium]
MSSNLRIGGLASGMDIDTIVADLMKAQRLRVDKIKQTRQIAEWQRNDYRDINNALRSLRDNVFNMKLQGNYLVKKASSSNESIAKAAATSLAVAGNYTLKVTSLAGTAKLNSSEDVAFNKDAANLKNQLSLTSAGIIKFKVNGSKEIEIDVDNETIDSLISKINTAKMSDDKTSAGVTAFFDKTINRMFVFSNSTGADKKIDFDAVAGFETQIDELFTKLKLDKNGIPGDGFDWGSEVRGTNAEFVFNGVTVTTQTTNQFSLAGINFTLTGTSTTETVNINVTNDTDTVFNSIKTFIDLYNTTIDKINSKLSEERYRDYLPLTDEQREKLSDDQEKKWEEKAKSGLLKNDFFLSGAVSKMRTTMSSLVSGVSNSKYDTLAEIGIKTLDYSEKGKLYIDETKLKEALAADPKAVMDLFTNSSDTYSNKGLAVRLYDDLTNTMNTITDKAGSASSYSLVDNSILGKRISGLDKEIDKWEDRLIEIEDRYWRQFTAMETALNKMNSQSAWLAQQFGGGK